ncbi:MAG: hypothetical protein ACO1N9_05275 [Flavobacterium sp.]
MKEIMMLLKRIMQMPENVAANYFSCTLLPTVIKKLALDDGRVMPVRQLHLLIATADFCEGPSPFTKQRLESAINFYETYCDRKQVRY